MVMSESLCPHGLIDVFYKSGTIDCFTFVFAERDPRTGSYTMLATDEEGRNFSQWTEGRYDPNGNNEHLGARLCVIGKALVERVRAREVA